MKNWFLLYGPSNIEKQAPGSDLIPAQFLPFYTSSPKFPSSAVPLWFQDSSNEVLSQFQLSSTAVPPQFQRWPLGWLLGWPLDLESDLVRKNLVGRAEELEWNRRNSAGIRIEQGCLFLQVPSTLAPISLFCPPLLRAKSHLKEGRPWTTFLSRSNEGRRFFQFAIENFKRRPLVCRPNGYQQQKVT